MQADGIEGFIEMSPHPLLVPALQPAMALPSLRREEPEQASLLASLGALFVIGHPIEWRRLYADDHAHVDLPHYPWQRERFWWEPSGGARVLRTPPVTRIATRSSLAAFRQADGAGRTLGTATWCQRSSAGLPTIGLAAPPSFPPRRFCEAALAAAREARPETAVGTARRAVPRAIGAR